MESLLTLEQLAAPLGLSVPTLYNRRVRGESLPPCIKLGRLLRYVESAVEAWLDAHREVSAGQEQPSLPPKPQQENSLPGPRRRGLPIQAEEIRYRMASDKN
ncbi:Helix-turn-helix domain protein [compost metagenome]